MPRLYLKNNFIGPVGSYEFHFVSGAPPTRNDNLSLFWPFDQYVWAFLIASAVTVSITLILINKVHPTLSNEASRETSFKSNSNGANEGNLNQNELEIFLGIMFTIGAIIEESQGNHYEYNYVSERKCSVARTFIVLKWTVLGFLLTISYKSVLRAIMMKQEYETPIDTIDDVLQSGKQIMIANGTSIKYKLETDPRSQIKKLQQRVEYFEFGSKAPEWIHKG